MFTFADIIEALANARPESLTQELTEAVIDSRLASAGSLFVAIAGENVDGHSYIGTAFANGAKAALAERPVQGNWLTLDLRHGAPDTPTLATAAGWQGPVCFVVGNSVAALQAIAAHHRRKYTPRVVGITGSVGKTTTKELVAQVLAQKFITQKTEGNFNNEIGLPMMLLKLRPDTEMMVLEMGFYVPGEIKLLCDIARPHVGVFTLIGSVHAERAGSKETIALGKGELAEALPPAPHGVCILNADDPYIMGMAPRTRAHLFTYGLTPHADLYATDVQGLGLEGIRCTLHHNGQSHPVQVPMPGKHSVGAVLRATAVALCEGMEWPQIIAGLQQKQKAIRLAPLQLDNGTLIIDDSYNANPESTTAALDLLGELPGRRIAVLGDMLELGQYEQQGHQQVGQKAAQTAQYLLTLGQRARTIAAAAIAAGMPADSVFQTETLDELLAALRPLLRGSETVLIKGSAGMGMKRVVSALENGS